MSHQVVILGGGTGGTLVANRLRRALPTDTTITVVDQDDRHAYQPGLLFVPFGLTRPEKIFRSRRRQLSAGVEFRLAAIDHVDIDAGRVHLPRGESIGYDALVVATGAVLAPEETEGLTGPGWMENVFTFYTPEGASALRAAMSRFEGGRIAVNVIDLPIKCPVAPLEFCFLADWYFHKRGNRNRVELIYVTPLDAVFTKPVAASHLHDLLRKKDIEVITEFNTGQVDESARKLISYDGRAVDFDLAVVVPLHAGAAYVARSPGLGDALNFIPTDPYTLQSKVAQNVFVVGDATDVPASKAGSVTHFEGATVTENVRRFLAGMPLTPDFDGHANCFVETGFHKALLVDFNYETEPVTGHYPTKFGLPLLRESNLNHLGKLGFEWLYWHSLLKGRELPGVTARMPHAGKALSA